MTTSAADTFIARWQGVTASELATAQSFVIDLCRLLDLETPHATPEQDYMFERPVTFRWGDGDSSAGRIDCYRRGAFVLEAKKLKVSRDGTAPKGFDDALLRARSQAEGYARALPAEEGRPPFLVVVDVGNVIELYAEFTRTGATYVPYPDPRSHRIRLADLRDEAVRARLRSVWLDPLSLDPTKQSARVTREIAAHLAEVAKSLEGSGHAPETVAGFLTRCLFSMFAEDVQLIPKGSFTELLKSLADDPGQFVPLLAALWKEMDGGGFSVVLRKTLPRFNGKLFKKPEVLPLTKPQIGLLIEAAKADWTQVEPAIFGTLLERALDPLERHALGAHYTPRAYVDRLVQPTVVEPLRSAWAYVQGAAVLLANEGKHKEAVAELRNFHHRLCSLRVLDPACGSGNFLYVALEHLKRLEGEVLNQLHDIGESQTLLEAEGLTVDPHQFLGLEINPRAAAIAELVLWIGYLQWHFRTQGSGLPPSPILKDFHNIECRDAVLAYDGVEFVTDERGVPVTRWDGRTMKQHPVTGEDVPDEAAQVPLERYLNPRAAEWPAADVVVGNPPYLGARTIRGALGDDYLTALRGAYSEVPDHADYVMYWWAKAARLVVDGRLSRFGLITTKSLGQEFSRKVVQYYMDTAPTFGYRFVIPNHPWVDASDGADVRVALTVCDNQGGAGRLLSVMSESPADDGEIDVELALRTGVIGADLKVGGSTLSAVSLKANAGMCSVGYQLSGKGFVVDEVQAPTLDPEFGSDGAVIWPLLSGRDIVQRARQLFAIDVCLEDKGQLRVRRPAIFQWLLDRVKPERDHNAGDPLYDQWWAFGRPRNSFRSALEGLDRIVVTSLTSKYRLFQFVPARTICDSTTVMFALSDSFHLGVLSSMVHVVWALGAGGRLGVGDDPRYLKARCFDPFPFPVATPEQQSRIADLAEQIDAHRKRVLAQHEDLTLTGLYNVLVKVSRGGTALNAREKLIHDKGLVAVLKSLHDELDAAVLDAYGWHDAPTDEQILERLVALNAERVAEEAQGKVRWLRPEFQAPKSEQAAMAGMGVSRPTICDSHEEVGTPPSPPAPKGKISWPSSLPDQMAALASVLGASPQSQDDLAAHFTGKGKWKARLPELLATLATLGRARALEDGRWMG